MKIIFFLKTIAALGLKNLKHLAKWVNEVEWVSKVKVILWLWSKVTQISKLNVWLLACILRWAIQGLMALLFTKGKHAVLMTSWNFYILHLDAQISTIYEQEKFHAQLSWAWKKFYYLRARLLCPSWDVLHCYTWDMLRYSQNSIFSL